MPELELLKLQQDFETRQEPYALATVVAVRGSASAKAGSKCLISKEGKNVWGWVGGGCAESFTIENALEAIREGVPRVIQADLDDEVFGLGMPCGGVMEIYVEPRMPKETVHLPCSESASLRALAEHYGLKPVFSSGQAPQMPAALIGTLARALAASRDLPFSPITAGEKISLPEKPAEFLILGHSRITQELAKLGALLGWPTRVYGLSLDESLYPTTVKAQKALPDYAGLEVKAGSFVVVASHHKGDHHYIQSALEKGAAYVGMVASGKRSGLVFDHLRSLSVKNLETVKAPAGLQLRCKNPGEIALSIVAELVGA